MSHNADEIIFKEPLERFKKAPLKNMHLLRWVKFTSNPSFKITTETETGFYMNGFLKRVFFNLICG